MVLLAQRLIFHDLEPVGTIEPGQIPAFLNEFPVGVGAVGPVVLKVPHPGQRFPGGGLKFVKRFMKRTLYADGYDNPENQETE